MKTLYAVGEAAAKKPGFASRNVYMGMRVSRCVSEAGKAGVICLSALWGTTAKAEELKSINADYIFETVGELKNYLMKNTNQKPEEAPIP